MAGESAAKVDTLRSAVDSWLAQLMGTLLARVGALLGSEAADLETVREV